MSKAMSIESSLAKTRAKLMASESASVAGPLSNVAFMRDRLQTALAARLRDHALHNSGLPSGDYAFFDVDTIGQSLGAIERLACPARCHSSLDAASVHCLAGLAMAFGKLQARDKKLIDICKTQYCEFPELRLESLSTTSTPLPK